MWIYGILLVIISNLVQYGNCDKFLIMHPFYSGSHVLTLHHVAEALVNRGHKVSQFYILLHKEIGRLALNQPTVSKTRVRYLSTI